MGVFLFYSNVDMIQKLTACAYTVAEKYCNNWGYYADIVLLFKGKINPVT